MCGENCGCLVTLYGLLILLRILSCMGLTKTKFSIPETNSVGPEASIDKAAEDPQDHADNVCDPVIHVGAAVKGGLDELN